MEARVGECEVPSAMRPLLTLLSQGGISASSAEKALEVGPTGQSLPVSSAFASDARVCSRIMLSVR